MPLSELTYTVVDLETTGLKPQGNGITEICCLRVSGGQVVDRFATLVNPGRPIPPFIQRMTGIDDAMVRLAPSFREIIPPLLGFLGESVLVAHHAPFDLAFLNYGLYANGYPSLHNAVIDTRRVARRLLPDLRRGSLDAVAQHLGIPVEDRHRASGDAEATAQLLIRLLSLCRSRGIESDDELLAFVTPRSRAGRPRPTDSEHTGAGAQRRVGPGDDVPRGPGSPCEPSCGGGGVLGGAAAGRLAVLAARCRSLPEAPGVYLMRSASGRVLYVGKAVALRRRFASYFGRGVTGKTRRMLREVETIEYLQLGSELEALLEESRLVKLHQPPFNTLLRSYRNLPFIRVDESGGYPRLVVTRDVGDDGARYFGPFRDARSTELVVEILSRCFRLFRDRCPTHSRGATCLYRQMGRCLAPCVDEEHRARHREAVEEVCRLLDEHPEGLVAGLVRRRDAAAERLDFEAAALYRDGVEALERALESRKMLASAVEGLNVLAVCRSTHPGWAELFVFGHGRLLARWRVLARDGESGRSSVAGLLEMVARRWHLESGRAPLQIDAESLDQVNIITTWLESQGGRATTITLEPGWANGRLDDVVDRVVALARSVGGESSDDERGCGPGV